MHTSDSPTAVAALPRELPPFSLPFILHRGAAGSGSDPKSPSLVRHSPSDQTDRSTQVQLTPSLSPLAILNSSIFHIVAVIRSQNHSARLPATFFTAVRRWLSVDAAAGSAHLGGLTSPRCPMA